MCLTINNNVGIFSTKKKNEYCTMNTKHLNELRTECNYHSYNNNNENRSTRNIKCARRIKRSDVAEAPGLVLLARKRRCQNTR